VKSGVNPVTIRGNGGEPDSNVNDPRMIDINNPLVFLPLFVVLWCAISVTLSFVGGWHALAQNYRATEPFSERRWHFRSAAMCSVNYGGVLTFGANTEGMFISPLFLLPVCHPPLFIPWSEFESAAQYRQLFFPMVILQFKKSPLVSLRISRGLAQAMAGEAQGRFSLAGS
jgi:hypothetical protein